MTQFYYPQKISSDEITLEGEEAYHLIKSYRVKTKEKIRLFDGNGNVYLAEVVNVCRDKVIVKILTKAYYERKFHRITLFQSIIKQDKFEIILEKITELGVDRIVPVVADRTEVDTEKFVLKYERFKKIILEATKQSNRVFITDLSLPKKFSEVFLDKSYVFDGTENIIAYKSSFSTGVFEVIKKVNKQKNYNLFIGPTGDFSPQEIQFFREQKNVHFVDLGKNILKSETAAIILCGMFVQLV